MGSRFTSELWMGIGDIYSAILVHPFLTGLATAACRTVPSRSMLCRTRFTWGSTPKRWRR